MPFLLAVLRRSPTAGRMVGRARQRASDRATLSDRKMQNRGLSRVLRVNRKKRKCDCSMMVETPNTVQWPTTEHPIRSRPSRQSHSEHRAIVHPQVQDRTHDIKNRRLVFGEITGRIGILLFGFGCNFVQLKKKLATIGFIFWFNKGI